MYRLIKLTEANDLRDFMNLACKCRSDVGVHTDYNQIADAEVNSWPDGTGLRSASQSSY